MARQGLLRAVAKGKLENVGKVITRQDGPVKGLEIRHKGAAHIADLIEWCESGTNASEVTSERPMSDKAWQELKGVTELEKNNYRRGFGRASGRRGIRGFMSAKIPLIMSQRQKKRPVQQVIKLVERADMLWATS